MRRNRGFTLIEIMIAIAVLAVLASIAYPTYNSYATRARRSDAQQIMLQIHSRQAQYVIDARAYADKLGAGGLNIAKDGWTCGDTGCSNTYYDVTVTLTAGPPPGYTITAAPKAGTSQAGDGNQTLTAGGVKTGSW